MGVDMGWRWGWGGVSALDGAGGQAGLPEALQAQEQHDQGDDT